MKFEGYIWRLVLEGISLHDLETNWSMDDVFRAIAALNVKADIQSEMLKGIDK